MKKIVLLLCLTISLFASTNSIKQNNLENEIGQMLIVGFRGMSIDENSAINKTIQELNLGGVILFDYDTPTQKFYKNIQNPTQVKNLCTSLQNINDTPLLIAVDAEGGKINRLNPKYGFINIPSHQKLGKINSLENTYKEVKTLAKELKELGINTNFAPVVDLNLNEDNPIIAKKERSFSSDPKVVEKHAKVFIKAHKDEAVLTAIKHFPGHGSSKGDTHLGLVDVTDTYQDIEMLPFKSLIKSSTVDMIMTSHIINRNFDKKYPITLSSNYITKILREKFSYKGVIVSDDLAMGAISKHYSLKETIIRAINAGCDLLIFSNNGKVYDEKIAYKAHKIILEALQSGEIKYSTIEKSLLRIKELKNKIR